MGLQYDLHVKRLTSVRDSTMISVMAKFHDSFSLTFYEWKLKQELMT